MSGPTPPVATGHKPIHNPGACSQISCTNTPTLQYQQTNSQGNTQAVFACSTHAYTDPLQQAGRHQAQCTLFPCNCTPVQPVSGPIGNAK